MAPGLGPSLEGEETKGFGGKGGLLELPGLGKAGGDLLPPVKLPPGEKGKSCPTCSSSLTRH